ncbi:pyridoxal phosphate-dependent aminotransferase [Deinococcus humi]|uniref:Histidinol-phosphate aminotransferase n=1 Tax=Deinococcus humi TaxID=662880 RepID=A0A7W8JPZ3_9DEIO|nr:histidinol-phosphate transaminase [Deinococcus humi]MBB5360979.1 histidinol-phosphate aminotransferase [Deinococcus humi]GGO17882.1 histidinol-phosphate aminotransferase [Deinococcus humi]
MTSNPSVAGAPVGVRPAVRAVPAYPFSPIQVPIKLDQNENPYDFPAELKARTAERMLAQPWNRYPDLHADTLAAKIARYEDWDTGSVVVTPGSNVLIKLLTELAGIEQTVLTVDPTFSVYTLEAKMLGARLVQVPLNEDFSMPVDRLKVELQRQRPGVLYITQPHAPTGHVDDVAVVRELLEAAGEWVVVLDEAYYQYSGTDCRDLVRQHPNALSLRTFSKAWGLAGLRAGYALAGADLATQLQKLVPAFNINLLTQAALEVALENPGYVQERVAEGVAERERVLAALADHPTCQAIPSRANFFLLRTPDAEVAYRHLIDWGIVTRRQDRLTSLEGCLRVGIGTPAENDTLIEAVRALK